MRYFLPASLLLLASCGTKPTTVDEFATRPVTMPTGQVIRAETAISDVDLARGLMFRTSLAADHGMLFVHSQPDRHRSWTYQNLIPVDMIWLDSRHNIVEMAENVQPCQTQASKCPQYGGNQISSYVLEIPAGMSRKFGLQLGQTIQW
jgi:uncharacterized membrane protein (UPF0127 family)